MKLKIEFLLIANHEDLFFLQNFVIWIAIAAWLSPFGKNLDIVEKSLFFTLG